MSCGSEIGEGLSCAACSDFDEHRFWELHHLYSTADYQERRATRSIVLGAVLAVVGAATLAATLSKGSGTIWTGAIAVGLLWAFRGVRQFTTARRLKAPIVRETYTRHDRMQQRMSAAIQPRDLSWPRGAMTASSPAPSRRGGKAKRRGSASATNRGTGHD